MLSTERLILRRWLPKDRAPFAALNADPEVMRYMPRLMTSAESNAWVDRIEAEFERDGFGLWVLEARENGRFIGMTGLNRVPFEASFTPAVEIGWRLVSSCWGRGLATEAASAVLRSGFVDHGSGRDRRRDGRHQRAVPPGDGAARDATRPGARLRA